MRDVSVGSSHSLCPTKEFRASEATRIEVMLHSNLLAQLNAIAGTEYLMMDQAVVSKPERARPQFRIERWHLRQDVPTESHVGADHFEGLVGQQFGVSHPKAV